MHKYSMDLATGRKLVTDIKNAGVKILRHPNVEGVSEMELKALGGYYDHALNEIYVPRGKTPLEFLTHEFGHKVELEGIDPHGPKFTKMMKDYNLVPGARRESEISANRNARNWLIKNSTNPERDVEDFKQAVQLNDYIQTSKMYQADLHEGVVPRSAKLVALYNKNIQNNEIRHKILLHYLNKQKASGEYPYAVDVFGDFDTTPYNPTILEKRAQMEELAQGIPYIVDKVKHSLLQAGIDGKFKNYPKTGRQLNWLHAAHGEFMGGKLGKRVQALINSGDSTLRAAGSIGEVAGTTTQYLKNKMVDGQATFAINKAKDKVAAGLGKIIGKLKFLRK